MFETMETREVTGGIRCAMCGVINWPTAPRCMGCNAALDKLPPRAVAPDKVVQYQTGGLSFSQSLARVFEIVDFLLLLPASYGMLLLLLFIGTAPFFTMAIGVWFIAGCFLLRGFFRHSRGRLKDTEVTALWWLTMAYNLVDLCVMWAIAAQNEGGAFYYFGLWPLLVIIFSGMALVSENRRREQFSDD